MQVPSLKQCIKESLALAYYISTIIKLILEIEFIHKKMYPFLLYLSHPVFPKVFYKPVL